MTAPPLTPVTDNKDNLKERKKRTVLSRPPTSLSVQCRDFCFEDFKNRTHQEPGWDKGDYVQLARLFQRKPDITFDDFRTRWLRFMDSHDTFVIVQGMSLAWFSTHYNRFIRDEVSGGNGNGQKSRAEVTKDSTVKSLTGFVARHS
jgi:hypothetical protein